MKQRLTHIDFLKIVGIILITFGHWIGTGTYATEIDGIISKALETPLLPDSLQNLWKLENFLYETFLTNPASLGTTLMFMASGYLTAFSRKKYTTKAWILSKIFRVFPVLAVACIFDGLLVYTLQGIRFPLKSYFVSITLTFELIPAQAITGVLGFLQVIVLFYLIAAFLHEFNWENIYCWSSFILLAQIIAWKFPNAYTNLLAYDMRYMCFLLTGAAFFLLDSEFSKRNVLHMIAAVLLCFSIFKVDRYLLRDETLYHTTGNIFLAAAFFITVMFSVHFRPHLFDYFSDLFRKITAIAMPFYLVHVPVGLLSIYYARRSDWNVYVSLIFALTATTLVSVLLHKYVEAPSIQLSKNLVSKHTNTFPDASKAEIFSNQLGHAESTPAPIVCVEDVSMMFNVSSEKVDNLKEYVIKFLKHELYYKEFWALKNISFQIFRQESFAIIGLNGSGKSTLLKLISGVLKPTSGKIHIYGSVAPLLELGAGFDMELSARENIFLNGCVLGYTEKEMASKYNSIVAFAELENFMDMPIKNFSSGMLARLGFAIATDVQPDILILDEVLAVGDYMFQKKCEERISNMQQNGTTIILVSHSTEQVRKLCKKALWLEHGTIRMIGDADVVCNAYENK